MTLSYEFKDLSAYKLSDFHLNGDYTFWEVRLVGLSDTVKTLFSYDSTAYQNLSPDQQKKIKETSSARGWGRCFPGGCYAYGIAVKGDSVKRIPGDLSLLSFFGPIDTEAELHFYLWRKPYYGKLISYKKIKSGYHVLVIKTNSCFNKYDKDLISVHRDGKITILKTLSTKTSQGCV
jgi:hypothetical protein